MDLIHWVGSLTAEDWQAVGSVGTLLVAGVAALYARSQVRVAQAVRADQAQPQVVIDFSLHNILVEIVVTNTGATTARDVKLEFNPPLESTLAESDPEFFSAKLLTDGIPTMPPGKEYRFLFESGPARYDRQDLPRSYTATARFNDTHGKNSYLSTYILDFETYFNLEYIGIYGLHDAAEALRKIEVTLRKWSETSGGLAVVSRDGDEKDRAHMRRSAKRRVELERQANEAATNEEAT
jgi:hypothetical protein